MRQRALSAAAAFSGALATGCLLAALLAGQAGPLLGFLAGTAAVGALVREVGRGRREQAVLPLWSERGGGSALDGVGEPRWRVVGVTRNLICLASSGLGRQRRAIWRDSVSADGFRRIAAYGLWRRSAPQHPVDSFELIARKSVRAEQSVARTGRPRSR
jgi:hypothetical protein